MPLSRVTNPETLLVGGAFPDAHGGPFRPRRYAPTSTATRVSVVIVNYCQWRNTRRLVRQLLTPVDRTFRAEILVVDNHSPHEDVAELLEQMEAVNVLHSPRNVGFARAVNWAAEVSGGDWLLLLNPDVTVMPGFLEQVALSIEQLEQRDPQAGVVGFHLLNSDGSRQASSGPFPTLLRTLLGLLTPRALRKCQHQAAEGLQRVPWVTGGCLLVRRDCFFELEGLDESFFLYYEDVDFCRRAEQRGWNVWYNPALTLTHHFPLHSRSVPAPLRLITRHALLTYARKHWPTWQQSVLAGIVALEGRVRALMAQFRGQRGSRECYDQLRGLARDYWHQHDLESRVRYAAARLQDVAAVNDGKTGHDD